MTFNKEFARQILSTVMFIMWSEKRSPSNTHIIQITKGMVNYICLHNLDTNSPKIFVKFHILL